MNVWGFHAANTPTYDDLDAIGEVLVKSLSGFLAEEIVVFEQHLVEREALAFSIKSVSDQRAIQLCWEGKLLYSVGSKAPDIDAELFVFVNGKRVGRKTDQGDSIFRLRCERSSEDGLDWRALGWQSDEFGEWSYLDAPRAPASNEIKRTLD